MIPQSAETLVREALLAGYKALEAAGEDARKIEGPQIDITTKGDLLVGAAITEFLKFQHVPPAAVYSEERGKEVIDPTSMYSVIFDGIDGTWNYAHGRGMLPYGTVLGVFGDADPAFRDCLAAGFLEFTSGNLYYAARGCGARVIDGFARGGDKATQIKTSGKQEINGPLNIAPDLYMLGSTAPAFVKLSSESHWLKDFACSGAQIALIADGSLDIFITADNCANRNKRKTGEELGPGYLLVKEAGGAVLDWRGEDIGPAKIGLAERKGFDVVVAATEELGQAFIVKKMLTASEVQAYLKDR